MLNSIVAVNKGLRVHSGSNGPAHSRAQADCSRCGPKDIMLLEVNILDPLVHAATGVRSTGGCKHKGLKGVAWQDAGGVVSDI